MTALADTSSARVTILVSVLKDIPDQFFEVASHCPTLWTHTRYSTQMDNQAPHSDVTEVREMPIVRSAGMILTKPSTASYGA